MAVRLGGALKELRIHLCQTGQGSQGVREFIEKCYVELKSSNPKFPILIRECSGVEPRVWARYEKGKEKCSTLKDMSSDEVKSVISKLAKDN
ncbi:unnamed protein product [Phyllotreta striolata]|uniref:NADH dehydrogenase [ubiquinone] 1 alpha subcomplex subunit 2 n=1 Tax=Phyllotreta striolata TaxID=444603 RepID=A0A9N9TWM1_PHYSR|nr:unnamed protein product [Phyllotreta striolata]